MSPDERFSDEKYNEYVTLARSCIHQGIEFAEFEMQHDIPSHLSVKAWKEASDQ